MKLTKAVERKVSTTYKLVQAVKSLYVCGNEKEQADYETVVGASIWYIKPKGFHTGMVSKELINLVNSGGCFDKDGVSEHFVPRKVAARNVLQNDLNFNEFKKYVLETALGTHLVTKDENNRLRIFQKVDVFVSWEQSYESAGVSLVKIDYGHK